MGSARAYLQNLIAAEGGFISFERFMQEALYRPEFGYYARRIPTVGAKGDFSTSATMHGALGKAVAAWAVDRRNALLLGKNWHLIELGGGNGQMTDEVLRGLGWWSRRRLTYHIVERSETLQAEQKARLEGWSNVRWHDEITAALNVAGGEALIFSNEFVDAFPCKRLEWDGSSAWREIGVSWSEDTGSFVEGLAKEKSAPESEQYSCSSVFDHAYTCTLSNGQRVEWHREYARWLQSWRSLWTRGAMLTIDYGEIMPAIYHRRLVGTLRAYFRHVRCTGTDIYARPGQQDLTADVNFTDLLRWGDLLGLSNAEIITQAEFLRRWLPTTDATTRARDLAYAFLTDENGAGTAFKVLEQQRG